MNIFVTSAAGLAAPAGVRSSRLLTQDNFSGKTAPDAAPHRTLAALFDSQCAEGGDRAAYSVVRDDLAVFDSVSFADLGKRCRDLANRLATVTRPGDRVLLALPTGLDFAFAFWACMLSGRVTVARRLARSRQRSARSAKLTLSCTVRSSRTTEYAGRSPPSAHCESKSAARVR